MKKWSRQRALLPLIPGMVTVLALLTGCGQSETVDPIASVSDPQFVVDLEPAAAIGATGNDPGGFETTAAQSKFIRASKGGTVQIGRYTLTIPPNALGNNQTYEIRYDLSDPRVVFELYPHGASFNVPVSIDVNMAGTDAANYDDVTLYWFDESLDQWVDVGGTWNKSTGILTQQLNHFSQYGGGRAGW